MADKKDYYELLGIAATATDKQIGDAFTKFTIRNHPDRKKTPDEKAAAKEIMKLGMEAKEVLLDPRLRKIYDSKGHQGVEDHKNGVHKTDFKSGATTNNVPREFKGDAMDFFMPKDKKDGKPPASEAAKTSFTPRERLSHRDRRRNFNANSESGNPAETEKTSPAVNGIAQSVNETTDKMQQAASKGVTIPAEEIAEMKKALQKFNKALDDALLQSKPKNGHSFNR